MIKIDDFICLFQRAAEAMEYAPNLVSVRLHYFECVLPRIALMDHDIEAELDRQIELLLE